jgi:tetratricopeptide (TPR) repeat protein
VLGLDHPDVADILNNLAAIYRVQGRYDEAEPLYMRALAILESVLDPDHHPDVARCLNNLAVIYQGQGRFAEALAASGHSVAVISRRLSFKSGRGSRDTDAELREARSHFRNFY